MTHLTYAPLSFEQERMWLLAQLHGAVPGFHERGAAWLDGDLDVPRLRETLETITRRHEILRTSFTERAGRPAQVISSRSHVELREIDLESQGIPALDARALDVAREEVCIPFDLERAPPWRVSLIRVSRARHLLVLTMHHIVSDGDWSTNLFLSELFSIYHGAMPPAPRMQYRDYSVWQSDHIQSDIRERQIAFWKGELEGTPAALEIPTDRPRHDGMTFAGEAVDHAFDPEVSRSLHAFAAEEGADIFSLMLAGLQALLHRYSRQDDILIGTPIPGRSHADAKDVLGYFGNPVVVRARLGQDPAFRDLLRQVQAAIQNARLHGDTSFRALVEELAPPRDPNRTPIFQVLYDVREAPRDPQVGPLLTLIPVDIDLPYVAYDLIMTVDDVPGRLTARLEYNRDLFDRATVARLLEHWEVLLRGAVALPDTRVSALPLLTIPERRRLVADWSSARAELPRDRCVHELFEEQVERTPRAIAVELEGESLTYQELRRRANRIARRLRAMGIGPEQRVGLCMDRSLDMIAGLLGILKSGACLVPFDPVLPSERIAYIIDDAALPVILTQRSIVGRLPCSGVHVLCADAEADTEEPAGEPDQPFSSGVLPENVAYIIYTSGSTGRPKGVLITHRSLVNHNTDFIARAGLGSGERVLQFASISFDAAFEEIFPALLSGATLVLSPEKGAIDFGDLQRLIEDLQLTVLDIPTSYWHEWVLELTRTGAGLPTALRLVVVGGEKARPERFVAWQTITGGRVRWINTYGPTEATIIATAYEPTTNASAASLWHMPIGGPLSNVEAYVLDRRMEPVPAGIPGELYIGGEGVARGYVNRPDLTALSFVPNPFSAAPGARLYRTGDIARWLPDKQLEFCGRADDQIKLRGHRIELGEIESTLRDHPAVQDVAVLAREDTPDELRLVAYVVPRSSPVALLEHRRTLATEQVEEWRAVYEESHWQPSEDPTLRIEGWNSSYTRQPIPAEEMREWRDRTVERILGLGPNRAWEIGCGTGLILLQVAPWCQAYTGTDFSASTLATLGEVTTARGMGQVTLLHRDASHFDESFAEGFDTVVLNSVVQYFPDADYLHDVLASAAQSVASGGVIFLGDVRNFDLLDAFHTSVELHRAPSELSLALLRDKVRRAVAAEEELLLAPDFFRALRRHVPRVAHAEILLKRGHSQNEMLRYRYDVVLYIGTAPEPISVNESREWAALGSSLLIAERWLAEEGPETAEIVGIPNARVAGDLVALRSLREDFATAGDVAARSAETAASAVNPEALWDLGERLGYGVRITWSRSAGPGYMDVLFEPSEPAFRPRPWTSSAPVTSRPHLTLASNPLRAKQRQMFRPMLLSFLRSKLPDYMIPAAFVTLDALPLTTSNKVDRRALPMPEDMRPELSHEIVAPRSEIEAALAVIFKDVLHADRIGVHDNFFELGGNSLHAVQVFSRVRGMFGVDVRFQQFFASPTIAALAIFVRKERGSLGQEEPLQAVPRGAPLPLSFAQERLWFLHRLSPDSRAYNCFYAFHLKGNADVTALDQALRELLKRHEILRTTFLESDGRPFQVIADTIAFHLDVVDLQHLSPQEREAEARLRLDAEAQRMFNLERGPLLFAGLLKLGADDHALWLHFHHITIDGWSIDLAFRELATLYSSFRRGTRHRLPVLRLHYADYAVWQRDQMRGESTAALLAWWKQNLAGSAPLISLPADHTRPPIQSFRGATTCFQLPPDLAQALKELSVRREMTLSMVLMTAFVVLIHKYSRIDDILIGVPSANRDRVDIEGILGFFVNTVPIRFDASGDPTFFELLGRVRAACLSAYERDTLPFDRLVQELRPERNPSYNPIVQVGFVPLPPAEHELRLEELDTKYIETDTKKTVLDITLYSWEGSAEGSRGVFGMFEYSTDLFEQATIERMTGHLLALLTAAVADPRRLVSALPLLTEKERHRALVEWNDTTVPLQRYRCVDELFEEQALLTPKAAAVVFDGVSLSYRELNERANRLAHFLRELGVGPERIVASFLEKSLDAVVAFFGILKAGGVYLPLDPDYPKDRLAFMIEDSAPSVLLTQEHLAGRLPESAGRIVQLDADWPSIARRWASAPPRLAEPENAAYIIYTSGSTGKPKGALVEHRNAVHLIEAQRRLLGVREDSRVLQFASLGFDASIWDIFMALTNGATLYMVPPRAALPGAELSRFLRRNRISMATLPPSVLARQPFELLPDLTTLIVAGEACPAELPDQWAGGRRFINAYGPTEATVCATYFECSPGAGAPPIGRPLPNVRVYILDEHGNPVPAGVPGELYIGGAGVARGYLNRDELTQQRFIPDPFSEYPDARLYRTGDLCRRLPDGNIEFLSRLDHQVKVRGYRIELGEVEAALREHPSVKEAIVITRPGKTGGDRLVAYVVPDLVDTASEAPDPALWKSRISEWHTLYDQTYGKTDNTDTSFNTTGWMSSFTGQPIPLDVMRAFRDLTVERLKGLRPSRVLEIGCGAGLLLLEIGPQCSAYVGTDFSEAALHSLQAEIAKRKLSHVTLARREASDFAGIDAGSFDTVILNSVAQYFPDAQYLLSVLRGAARCIAPGGAIFVGDVRSLPLLEAFHTAVELYKPPHDLPVYALRERVARAITNEKELVLSPSYFQDLPRLIPEITQAEVWLKRGHGSDEMTRYRYDVVLYVGTRADPVSINESRDWEACGGISGLERWLLLEEPEAVEVLKIPNGRVYRDVLAARRLERAPGNEEARAQNPDDDGADPVHPESLWELGQRLGYAVRVTWSRNGEPGCIDALFERPGDAALPRAWIPREANGSLRRDQPETKANNPLRDKKLCGLVPALRDFLRAKLPDYMIPSALVKLGALPLTHNGKVDRAALPDPDQGKSDATRTIATRTSELEEVLLDIWRRVLDHDHVTIDDAFFDIGGHSLLLTQVQAAIKAQLSLEVPIVDLFRYPSIRLLSAHLEAGPTSARPASTRPATDLPRTRLTTRPPARPSSIIAVRERVVPSDAIAIIGMSGRFPKARDVDAFFGNLVGGVESISFYTPEQLDALGVDPALIRSPKFVPAGGVLEDAFCFDASFFGYSPREAQLMDPQHRAFLECAWEAMERAGYNPLTHPKSIGIFAGCDAPMYWLERIGLPAAPLSAEEYQVSIGNVTDNLTTRVAYKLGLRGPAVTLLTACSTSLVAVHFACRSLMSRECDMVLAGGVVVLAPSRFGHLYEDGSLTSPDGHCRPFDADARGTVGGSGVGIVVLKRLEEALADGDTIHAVIRGSAISNDGAARVGYTAPGPDGQFEAIVRAHEAAGVHPETISYVEAHGTATRLGDPIEIAALTRAFRVGTKKQAFCALGSVKSNVGHLGAAAGVTGLIKATLSLEREVIPPTLHFRRPNPALDLETSPFFVPSEPLEWKRGTNPRRAGVSAFGLGGTNAHVVLEEAPEREPSGPSRSHQILILSARTPRALDESTTRLAEHLRRDPGTSLADVAFTLQQGRAAFEHRRAVIGSDPGAASRDLLDHDPARVVSGRAEARAREVVFMFPGGGTQHADMGLELYLSEKIYQESLDRCAALFQDELSVDIRTLLFPKREAQGRSAEKLLRPSINLAVIFSTEVALANTLMAWGIRPAAVTGHSLGEYAAAYFAGVISLEDAVALIALRGRLYEELPSGAATLIVRLSEEEITARLGEDLSLAAVNSSDSCVISGVGRAIERLEADLRRDGCDVRRLPIAVAAHSSLINPIADRLTQRAAAMTLLSPRIPVISNVTGRWMSDADARDPSYWARHLRRPVRFGDGLSTLLANGDCALVEVGPGRTLSSLSRKHPGAGPARVISTTMAVSGSDRTEIETLLCAVAELWCAGVPVDWAAFSRGERRRRVPLPTYCFERAPHVVEAPAAARTSRAAASATPRSASSLPPPPLLKVPAIPHITMGTRSDRPAMAADEAETRADPVASTLASIWRKVLGVRAVRARDNFFDVGGNSLIAVQLRAHVQDLLNVNLPVHALVEHRTFGALTDRIRKELGAARPTQPPAQAQDGSATRAVRPGQLLVKLHEGAPGRSPLFLIQPIGGTVYTYYTLARSLPRSLPVYGIRASGMDPGEEVLADIAIMAERYLEEVRLIQPRGPYLLGGHSAGGVIAYEMAQQLLNRGQEVPLLLMIDSPSPSSAWRTSIKTAEDILQNMRELYDVSSHGYRSFVEALSKDGPFRTLVLHTWNALGAYTPRPTRAGVVYIRAEEQPDAEQADALRHWMDLARGPFSCHKVAGNHFTVMEAPGADLVARMVSQHTALYGEAIGFDAGAPSSRPGRAAEGRTTVPPPSSSGVVYSAKRDLL